VPGDFFNGNGFTFQFGQVCFSPVLLPSNVPVQVGVFTLGATSGDKARIALYSGDSKYGMPSLLVSDAGKIILQTTPNQWYPPVLSSKIINTEYAGIYWIAIMTNRQSSAVFGATYVLPSSYFGGTVVNPLIATMSATLNTQSVTFCAPQTYGAFPISPPSNLVPLVNSKGAPVNLDFIASRP
jgi:hypothetical protein